MSRLLAAVTLLVLTFPLAAQHADLVLEGYVPPEITTGDDFLASVTVRNLGPDPAENVVFTTSVGRIDGPGCTGMTGRCDVAILQCGEDQSFVVRANDLPLGRLAVTLETTSATSDPNPRNNRLAATTTVTRAPRVSLSFYSGIADPGEPVEVRVAIGNESRVPAEQLRFEFDLPDGWTFLRSLSDELRCSVTDRTVDCSVASVPPNSREELLFELRAPPSLAGAPYKTTEVRYTTAHGNVGGTTPGISQIATFVYRHLTVTNTNDDGEGSLRSAIDTANGACAHPEPPCKIAFDIAGEGTHRTIRPASPLPSILKAVVVDGATQTRRHGDTNPHGPEIEVNGSLLAAGDGFDVAGPGANFTLRHVAVNGFPGNGVVIRAPGWLRVIDNCYIGTDVTGRIAVPNGGRGVVVDITGESFIAEVSLTDNVISGNARSGVFANRGYSIGMSGNRIGVSAGDRPEPLPNGASGIYLGGGAQGVVIQKNVIAHNADAGIATAPSTGFVSIRGNSIAHNGGLGIDYGLDSVTPNPAPDAYGAIPPFPVITSATYDPATGVTRIEGSVQLRWRPSIADVELFASTSNDPAGHGEGELFLGRVAVDANFGFTFDYRGDLRGRFLSATFTQPNNYYPEAPHLWTSEFGPSFMVSGEAAAPIDPATTVPRGADLWLRLGSYPQLEAGATNRMWTIIENLGPAPAGRSRVELTTDIGRLRSIDSRCDEVGTGLHCELDSGYLQLYFEHETPLGARDNVTVRGRIVPEAGDPDPSNNEAAISVRVNEKPSLFVEISSSGPVDPGAAATYSAYVANRTATAARDVEIRVAMPRGWTFVSAEGWDCTAEGEEVVCRSPVVAGREIQTFSWTVRAPEDESGMPRFDVRAKVITPSGPQWDANNGVAYEVFRILRVTNAADAGNGSLRDAIVRANAECGTWGPNCKIVFAIPATPVIRPATPLPVIDAENLTLDARTQGSVVELDGSQLAEGNGFDVRSAGRAEIRGFAIVNFPENGIVIRVPDNTFNYFARRAVADNRIANNRGRGVVIEGAVQGDERLSAEVIANEITGNGRAGLSVDRGWSLRVTANRIGGNGASGVYLAETKGVQLDGNEIAHNAHAGVALGAASKWTALRGNVIHSNGGLAIDHGLDAVTPNEDAASFETLPPFPLILSAVWDESAKVTRVEGRVKTLRFGGRIEVFANDEADASGFGEAQRPVGEIELPRDVLEHAFTITVAEDLRGKIVTSTLTLRSDYSPQWTSEVSGAVRVP